jgi:hypothetical protein
MMTPTEAGVQIAENKAPLAALTRAKINGATSMPQEKPQSAHGLMERKSLLAV